VQAGSGTVVRRPGRVRLSGEVLQRLRREASGSACTAPPAPLISGIPSASTSIRPLARTVTRLPDSSGTGGWSRRSMRWTKVKRRRRSGERSSPALNRTRTRRWKTTLPVRSCRVTWSGVVRPASWIG
jgi:hypothetical protein